MKKKIKKVNRSLKTEAITRAQRYQIAAESLCDERSIAAVYNARPTQGHVWRRVSEAAVKLKLPPPPGRVAQG